MANHQYKDSLFRFLFNNPAELCTLYHAIAPDTSIKAEDIRINTMDSILMDRLKNDISFLIPQRHIVLMEHQSTWTPNIPLRCLWYAGDLYRHAIPNRVAMYGTRLIQLPAPQFYVFYIGDSRKPYTSRLRLSDAFLASSDELELCVTVFNITYAPESPLLKHCPTLHDYSFFIWQIDTLRKQNVPLDIAIRKAVEKCAKDGILKNFICNHYEEVCNMVTLWYDEKEAREYWRQEAREIGLEEGREQGLQQGLQQGLEQGLEQGLQQGLQQGRIEERESTALSMLRDKLDIAKILQYTQLPIERIQEIGKLHNLL